jgi:hypothetical protein
MSKRKPRLTAEVVDSIDKLLASLKKPPDDIWPAARYLQELAANYRSPESAARRAAKVAVTQRHRKLDLL